MAETFSPLETDSCFNVCRSREPNEYWGFARSSQPSVFGGSGVIRAFFVGLPSVCLGATRPSGEDRVRAFESALSLPGHGYIQNDGVAAPPAIGDIELNRRQ